MLRSIITIILASCSRRKDTYKISQMKMVKREKRKKRMTMKKKTKMKKMTQMRKMTMIIKMMRMKIVQTEKPR